MGSMLDMNALRQTGVAYLDLCASNAYVIGQASVWLQGTALSVQLAFNPSANVEVQGLSLYLIPHCADVNGDPSACGLPTVEVGDWLDVGNATSVFLYMPMQVSYDPAGLPVFNYDLSSGELQYQLALWQQQNRGGLDQAAATPEPEWLPTSEPPLETQTPTDPFLLVETAVPSSSGTDEALTDPAVQSAETATTP